MPLDLQTIAALLIVAAAATLLARRAWRTLSSAGKRGRCGTGCGQCPADRRATNGPAEPGSRLVDPELPVRLRR